MPLAAALPGLLVDVAEHDLGALLGKPDGAGLPDALRRTGDERNLAGQQHEDLHENGGTAQRLAEPPGANAGSDGLRHVPSLQAWMTPRARRQRPATSRNGDQVSAGNFHQT